MNCLDIYGTYFSRCRPSAPEAGFASGSSALHSPLHWVPSYIFNRSINYKLFASYAFIPLAASSRSRSWCGSALINSEGAGARQTSRKTAMHYLISLRNMLSLSSSAAILRGQSALARALPLEYLDLLRRDGAHTRPQTRRYGMTSASNGVCRCSYTPVYVSHCFVQYFAVYTYIEKAPPPGRCAL